MTDKWTEKNDVPSLELCIQMEDAEFPQEGLWYWILPARANPVLGMKHHWKEYNLEGKILFYLAPTVGQMGEWYWRQNITEEIPRSNNFGSWITKSGYVYAVSGEANARAVGLLRLAEKKLIVPERLGKGGIMKEIICYTCKYKNYSRRLPYSMF